MAIKVLYVQMHTFKGNLKKIIEVHTKRLFQNLHISINQEEPTYDSQVNEGAAALRFLDVHPAPVGAGLGPPQPHHRQLAVVEHRPGHRNSLIQVFWSDPDHRICFPILSLGCTSGWVVPGSGSNLRKKSDIDPIFG